MLTNTLATELPRACPGARRDGDAVDISRAQALAMNPAALRAALAARGVTDPAAVAATGAGLRASFAAAILGLFPLSAVLFVVSGLVTLFVPGRRLRGREETMRAVASEAGAPGATEAMGAGAPAE